ncbi:MAG: DUF3224 domain-containing protein, partial [Terriglobales bacterium]
MRILTAAAVATVVLGAALTVFAAQVQPAEPHGDASKAAQSNSDQVSNPRASNQEKATDPRGTSMTKHAAGSFDVKVIPQKPDNKEAEAANFGRMSLDKQFHGDLEATSKGEMIGAMTEVKGSAGYVAMERVTGTLDGRTGTFVLQHSGTMTRGAQSMNITVVPDSG